VELAQNLAEEEQRKKEAKILKTERKRERRWNRVIVLMENFTTKVKRSANGIEGIKLFVTKMLKHGVACRALK
jgi:hypothetical protein